MRRISTFLIGVVVGIVLLWGAMHFHLIRSQQGFHLVAKRSATLADAYVDARSFGPADWLQRPAVAEAVLRSNNDALIDALMGDAVQNGLDKLLPPAPPKR
ncbi:MAG: hypothetical protein KF688_06180 [Pirellulales bacterium]|nr:hypothetical protein [Pirellulales bacterium]